MNRNHTTGLCLCGGIIVLLLVFLLPAGSPAASGDLKWTFEACDEVNSSPAIGQDNTVYVGSRDGNLYAVDPNGAMIWAFQTDGAVQSSPAIGENGTIFVGSDDGNIYAVYPDGTLKWAFETPGPVSSTPAIAADGTIYAGSDDGNVYAITPLGNPLWSFPTVGPVKSSPAVGPDGAIYAGSTEASYLNGKLYAINPDGTQRWSLSIATGVEGSPAIGPDSTIYVGSRGYGFDDAKLFAIDPNGNQKWVYDFTTTATMGHLSPPAVRQILTSPAIGADGTIYVSALVAIPFNLFSGLVAAVDPDGNGKWVFDTNGPVTSSPAVAKNGTIYVGSPRARFQPLGYDGVVYAITLNGNQKWAFPTGAEYVHSSPAIGTDGTVYVGASDGKFYAIEGSLRGLANSSWPMFHRDLKHTGRAAVTWQTAHDRLFKRPDDLFTMRQYRDVILAKSRIGKIYTKMLYRNSEKAMKVLMDNPELMREARGLIEANKDAIREVLKGNEGIVDNTDNILSFLDAYAKKSPPGLKFLIAVVKWDIRNKQRMSKPFLRLRLR
jgi:outer membrane protein assembly factor BamB